MLTSLLSGLAIEASRYRFLHFKFLTLLQISYKFVFSEALIKMKLVVVTKKKKKNDVKLLSRNENFIAFFAKKVTQNDVKLLI